MTLRERVSNRYRLIRGFLTPSTTAWRGAAYGVWTIALALATAVLFAQVLTLFSFEKLLAYLIIVLALVLAGLGVRLGFRLVSAVPAVYRRALFLLAPILVMLTLPGISGTGTAIILTGLLLGCGLIGGAITVLIERGSDHDRPWLTYATGAVGLIILVAGAIVLFGPKESENPALADVELEDRTLDLDNPATRGSFHVATLTYGSDDPQRPEYGEDADLTSRSVDASKLIDGWDGIVGWIRSSYWDVDPSNLPLQGRVWHPQGPGPFPLVLVVHGNHAMEDFSDVGYGYLGELLASRGIIVVSVDENFLNSSIADTANLIDPGLEEENDARGWLLLEHLRLWREWNATGGHRFEGKVDMDRVALIGHSRGGEAVATAAIFNQLDHYPDDATMEFDFGFNLRGVIAIAPADGQYKPRGRRIALRDVNYFVIHGSMDGDVTSFVGASVYSRASFSGEQFRFKSGLYVVGANHGQFNTAWGRCDLPQPWCLSLDTRPIMDAGHQRQIAKVYFSAFLEVVLRDNLAYLPLLSDPRRGAAWLPQGFYLSNYADSSQLTIADFEEDPNPTTATLSGATIRSDKLAKWRESWIEMKWADLDTHVAILAWDERVHAEPAYYAIELPDDSTLTGNGAIVFSLSAAAESSTPDDWEANGTAEDPEDDEARHTPLDWTVTVTDRAEQSASLPLSHDLLLYPQVRSKPRLSHWMSNTPKSEFVFRRYLFALQDFAALNPTLDVTHLREIRFTFDKTPRGAIALDDVALVTRQTP